jgi:hypothetical protein
VPNESWSSILDERSFVKVLKLYYNLIQSLNGYTAGDPRVVQSHGLAEKLLHHAASAYWLSKGTRVPDMPDMAVDFHDHSSITLIARAALECYLMFYYIFLDPDSDDEFEFRYNAWMLAGLALREGYPFPFPEHQAVVAAEKPLYESHRKAIKGTRRYRELKPNEQDRVRNGKGPRLDGWVQIARKAGFGPIYSKALYGYLSDYAHSGGLATLQVSQAQSREAQLAYVNSSLRMIMFVLCRMIDSWTERFPESAECLESDPVAAHICEEVGEAVRRLP